MPSASEASSSSLSNIPPTPSTTTPNPESSTTPSIVAETSSDQEATPTHSRSGSMSSIRSGNTTPGLHPLWTAQFDKRHRGESNASISSLTSTSSSLAGFNLGGGTNFFANTGGGGPSNGSDGTCSPQMNSVRPNRTGSAGGTKGGGISSLINKFNNNNESPTAAPLRSFTIPPRKGMSASPSALSSPTTTVPPPLPAPLSSALANNPFMKAAGRPRASSSSLLDQVATMPLGKPSSLSSSSLLSSSSFSSSFPSSAAVPPAAGETTTSSTTTTPAATTATTATTTATTTTAITTSASTSTQALTSLTAPEDAEGEQGKKNVTPESAGSALSDCAAPNAPSKDRCANNTFGTAMPQRRGSVFSYLSRATMFEPEASQLRPSLRTTNATTATTTATTSTVSIAFDAKPTTSIEGTEIYTVSSSNPDDDSTQQLPESADSSSSKEEASLVMETGEHDATPCSTEPNKGEQVDLASDESHNEELAKQPDGLDEPMSDVDDSLGKAPEPTMEACPTIPEEDTEELLSEATPASDSVATMVVSVEATAIVSEGEAPPLPVMEQPTEALKMSFATTTTTTTTIASELSTQEEPAMQLQENARPTGQELESNVHKEEEQQQQQQQQETKALLSIRDEALMLPTGNAIPPTSTTAVHSSMFMEEEVLVIDDTTEQVMEDEDVHDSSQPSESVLTAVHEVLQEQQQPQQQQQQPEHTVIQQEQAVTEMEMDDASGHEQVQEQGALSSSQTAQAIVRPEEQDGVASRRTPSPDSGIDSLIPEFPTPPSTLLPAAPIPSSPPTPNNGGGGGGSGSGSGTATSTPVFGPMRARLPSLSGMPLAVSSALLEDVEAVKRQSTAFLELDPSQTGYHHLQHHHHHHHHHHSPHSTNRHRKRSSQQSLSEAIIDKVSMASSSSTTTPSHSRHGSREVDKSQIPEQTSVTGAKG
ncbi:hypothetical protein DFQ27_002132 [Actinomortierella ambigua]|uniref:Uncharacterized protein n=1 Tax=Actinomortierella ambigua TaxID=1343610 RepID=A0A9P6QB47_9FUNG|nr:hypothetical protein DFQ27_002132 [Actinomortierella ambigua]